MATAATATCGDLDRNVWWQLVKLCVVLWPSFWLFCDTKLVARIAGVPSFQYWVRTGFLRGISAIFASVATVKVLARLTQMEERRTKATPALVPVIDAAINLGKKRRRNRRTRNRRTRNRTRQSAVSPWCKVAS
jgi:hypothetical protein